MTGGHQPSREVLLSYFVFLRMYLFFLFWGFPTQFTKPGHCMTLVGSALSFDRNNTKPGLRLGGRVDDPRTINATGVFIAECDTVMELKILMIIFIAMPC